MQYTDDQILEMAAEIARKRLQRGPVLTNPLSTRRHLRAMIGSLEHEVFVVIFLDNRHQAIATEEMFRGTIDGAAVHPREVVKRALQLNAAALIFAHNHPSGIADPSTADRRITQRLADACSLLDIRVLDHLVIGGESIVSFAERGLI